MRTIHEVLLDEMKEDLEPIEARGENVYFYLFANHRMKGGKPTGIRLTRAGNKLMSKYFTNYTFENYIQLTPQRTLKLDKKMNYPYFIDKGSIVLYSEEDAAWYRLAKEDIDTFLDNL